jgi:hypothetical protein
MFCRLNYVVTYHGPRFCRSQALPPEFQFLRFTKDTWGMALDCTDDKGGWRVAYLYNIDKSHNAPKSEFLMYQ